MSERKLIILGTASQVPGRYRNQSGYFLRFDDQGFLFDPGEGTQRQMIYGGVSVTEITKIFITHFHGDHCLGLAGIIQRLSLDRVLHEVEVYYPESGQEYFERLKSSSIYYNVARLKECPVSEEGIISEDDKLIIETYKLDHIVETWGYRIKEKDTYTVIPSKLKKAGINREDIGVIKSKGFINLNGQVVHIEDVGTRLPGQSLAFVMDTRVCDAAYRLAQGVDILLCESTYLSDMASTAREYGHLTAAQAAHIAHKSGAIKLVLSHFSQRYVSTEEFINEASAIHENVIAARDGEHIAFPKRKRVMK